MFYLCLFFNFSPTPHDLMATKLFLHVCNYFGLFLITIVTISFRLRPVCVDTQSIICHF